MQRNRLLITGGHVTPALAVADILIKRGWEIFYVGRLHALEGDSAASQEVKLTRNRGMHFLPISTGRLSRQFSWNSLISVSKIPWGFIQAFWYIFVIRPTVILSFGSYVAFPLAIMGKLWRIPLVVHEQTRSPGLANRILGNIADIVCVAWKEISTRFPLNKTIYTGNPLRKELFSIQKRYALQLDKPLVYVTGGNLGAHAINTVIEEILPQLLTNFCVIHQCGNSEIYQDYNRLLTLKNRLPQEFQYRYLPVQFVEPEYIGWVLKSADLVLSRAGANSVTELMVLKKAALLVPLPLSAAGEQEKNAYYLKHHHAALVLDQKNLNSQTLLDSLQKLIREKSRIQAALQLIHKDLLMDGDARVAHVIESLS